MEKPPPILPQSESETFICRNCGHRAQGKFCSECGQAKLAADDLHVVSAGKHVFGHFFDLEFKWLYSLWLIFTKPGQATLDFIEGRRGRHAHPLALFSAVAAAYLFLAPSFHPITGFTHMIARYCAASGLPFVGQCAQKAGITVRTVGGCLIDADDKGRSTIGRITPIEGIIVAGVVVSGFVLWGLFGLRRRVMAEHFVMASHLACFNLIAIGIVAWTMTFVPFLIVPLPMLFLLGIDLAYFLVAAKRVYRQHRGLLFLKWGVLQTVLLAYAVLAAAGLVIYAAFTTPNEKPRRRAALSETPSLVLTELRVVALRRSSTDAELTALPQRLCPCYPIAEAAELKQLA